MGLALKEGSEAQHIIHRQEEAQNRPFPVRQVQQTASNHNKCLPAFQQEPNAQEQLQSTFHIHICDRPRLLMEYH